MVVVGEVVEEDPPPITHLVATGGFEWMLVDGVTSPKDFYKIVTIKLKL